MDFSEEELIFSRFSVVDSMLSSLSSNQNLHDFTSGPTAAQAGQDFFSSAPLSHSTSAAKPASNTGRRRGHTQSSSLSSYDNAHVDDIARGYSEYHAKGRPATKQQNRPLTGIKSSYGNGSTSVAESYRHTRSVTRGSKGSGSSSVDLGYKSFGMNNSKPIPHRAASFDHGYSPSKNFTNAQGKDSPVPIDYTAFDAAPTPTIPAGPRRPSEPLSPLVSPLPPNASKQKPAPSRRNSVKSTAAKSLKKSKSSAPMNSDIRDQAKQFVQYTSNTRNAPPASGSAPSPTVATIRKSRDPAPAPPPTKEQKPGFFRRVFGGAKHDKPVHHQEEVHRPPSPAAVRRASSDANAIRPRTQPNQQIPNMQFKSSSRPPTQDPSSTGQMREPQLRKAHSSFFRRRKKSMSDNAPPPVPPLDLKPNNGQPLNVGPSQKSPGASSLVKAMTPYLDQVASPLSPQDMFFDSKEQQSNGASPVTYAGGFPSSIADGLRRSMSRQGTRDDKREEFVRGTTIRTVNQENQKPQTGHSNVTGNFENGSFLVDSSSNESPIEAADDLGIITKRPTTQTVTRPKRSSSLNRGEHNLTVREANIGEKRIDAPMLSPISDRSHQQHEVEILDDDEGGIVVTAGRRSPEPQIGANNRVWLDPSSSDEKLNDTLRLSLPLEGPRTSDRPSPTDEAVSPASELEPYISASSLPTLQVGDHKVRMSTDYIDAETAKAIMGDDLELSESDRARAEKIFDGDEEFVTKASAAAWLGQTTALSTRTRKAYMELYDWAGLNILAAFRELCGRLVVRAESQELDRVIEAFSARWCASNPNHGFKDGDVVHTITFSILMLNTDLHIADIDQRMTRSQFVKNTLPTIRSIAEAAAPDATETTRAKGRQARDHIPWDHPDANAQSEAAAPPKRRPSIDLKRNRLSIRPPMRNDSYDENSGSDGCNILVKAPCAGSMKDWETQIEIVLREFYNSIRQQRLPLHGHTTNAPANLGASENSQAGLSVMSNGLRRTPSVLSKAPSENASHRGRSGEHNRFNTGRFGSKNRSRPRVYPSSTIGSSRTSLDDNSVWSPAASTWSKYSLGKTQTSMMSVESFGSHFAQQDYQKAIGFANALSQAIIREEGIGGNSGTDEMSGRVVPLLEDDTLGLLGPPWAKEGIVKHKHHLESLEKKAKDRNWAECFAVIEKGWIKMFSFNNKSKSTRQRAKSRGANHGGASGAVVGGGNWTENAELLSEFLLRQTIASALPSPGYSKSRPHVFALSLPTGAVHLFQVGTAEIVKEFVSTANYWSARLSKPPLIGGVSNIEYGWGDSVLNPALLLQRPESATPGQTPGTSSSNHSGLMGRNSINGPSSPHQSSHGGRRSDDVSSQHGGYRMRLPGDKVQISEWSPPTQSMMASQLMEIDQLRELSTYVANVEEELKKHNELRPLMGMAVSLIPFISHLSTYLNCKQFSPRHANATKALGNWEKKSAYLLREIVKFKTYVDSLKAAQQQKEVINQEREARAAEKAARGGDANEEQSGEASASRSEKALPPAPINAGLGVQDVPPPMPSPTTTNMLDAMPMPPKSSQSA